MTGHTTDEPITARLARIANDAIDAIHRTQHHTAEEKCPYVASHGRHLYVGYRVAATGNAGEACHGCGIEREDHS